MRTAKAALALLLSLSIPVRAETTTDPLWYLLSTNVLAPDAKAVEAEGDGRIDAKGLAALQSDLLLLSDGFEAFRDEAQVKETLERLKPRMSPEFKPFFKDRAASLDAIYRTLAVTDYTWARRFPEPPCAPTDARRRLLDSRDGLFQTENGEASPWLVTLLGPEADGKSAEQALDQASIKTKLSGADYEKQRARVRKLNLALASDKAVGAARSRLYCSRAAVFEDLAAHHRSKDAELILAGRAVAQKPEESVFVVVWKDKRAAATLVRTKSGVTLVTDAAIVADTDHPSLFAFAENEKPVELTATVVRRHPQLSVAVLAYTEDLRRPTLTLAEIVPAKNDLVTAVGHTMVSGLWTKTSGLVTKVGDVGFQTDAAISPELSGGPVLNEAGEVAGILVLRPADTEEGRWPVAIPAPVLARWLDDPASSFSAAPATEAIEDGGTAAILSRARPSALTEAGLGDWNIPVLPPPPSVPNGVCMRNCEGSSSPSSSYSGGYSNDAAGAELGEALGKLGAVLVLQGIPALFRGIGSLFKAKPGVNVDVPRREAVQVRPREIEIPPEPPKLTGLTLTITPEEGLEGETLTATAELIFSGDKPKKDGISVVFTDDAKGKIVFPNNQPSYSAPTDASGKVTISFELSAIARDLQQPFDEMKDEERRRAGEEAPSRMRPVRKPKNAFEKVKQRAPDAFDSLDKEERKSETEELPADQTDVPEAEATTESDLTNAAVHVGPIPAPHFMPLMDTPVPLSLIATFTMTASATAREMGSAKGDDKVKVVSGDCPPGTEAQMTPPDQGQPGQPASASPQKAALEGACLPFEKAADMVCSKDQPCQDEVLLSLGYDFRSCLRRWEQDGSGSSGSIGTPPINPSTGRRRTECVPLKKTRTKPILRGVG